MKSSFLGKIIDRAEHLSREELVRYLSRLARENGVLETVLGSLKEGVVVLNHEGIIRYLNPVAYRLLPIPQSLPDQPRISHYLKELNWESLLTGSQSVSRLLEINYPEHRILDFSLLPIELSAEASDAELEAGFVGIFHDVTKQHMQTREVIESERVNAVTMLAAGVAHELGNPINNLNIHLQLMERDVRELPDKQQERMQDSIQIAREEVGRLDIIIHEFLQAIRPTVPDLQPLGLEKIVKETITLLEREISNQSMLVEMDFEQALPPILGDEGQLKQVFYNLVKNALQAMAEKGILTIEGRLDGEWVCLSFRDNGEGIAMEDIPQVMQPFYTTKKRGTGLGLMIVQRIVREHGGQLEIESNQGQGTTVRIKLPYRSKQVKLLE